MKSLPRQSALFLPWSLGVLATYSYFQEGPAASIPVFFPVGCKVEIYVWKYVLRIRKFKLMRFAILSTKPFGSDARVGDKGVPLLSGRRLKHIDPPVYADY